VNPFDVGIGPPGQARAARGDGPLSNRADFCWRRIRSAFSAEAERSSAADRILVDAVAIAAAPTVITGLATAIRGGEI